jgi:hypothetical protein
LEVFPAGCLHCCLRIGICDGRILAFRHAGTEVEYCFIVEDNTCRLIINVKPELKLIKDLLPIALPSSPAIANTFVTCCLLRFANGLQFFFKIISRRVV